MKVPYPCLNCFKENHRKEDCPFVVLEKIFPKSTNKEIPYQEYERMIKTFELNAEKINFLQLDLSHAEHQISKIQLENNILGIEKDIKDLVIKNLNHLLDK